MKTRKSIAKRFKITRTGKVLRRKTGQDHSLAKKSSKRRRAGRKWIEVSKPEAKKIKKTNLLLIKSEFPVLEKQRAKRVLETEGV